MSRRKENTGFVCEHCSLIVLPLTNGSYRNHCPRCLYSKHVDVLPGDRMNTCKGLMRPVRLEYKPMKGYQIIHRCLNCGMEKKNKTAEVTDQPDDIDQLILLTKQVKKRRFK